MADTYVSPFPDIREQDYFGEDLPIERDMPECREEFISSQSTI